VVFQIGCCYLRGTVMLLRKIDNQAIGLLSDCTLAAKGMGD